MGADDTEAFNTDDTMIFDADDTAVLPADDAAVFPADDAEASSPIHIVEDYPENGFDISEPDRAGEIEEAVAAFSALDSVSGDDDQGAVSLPKASGTFPFGAKERPVRQKFDAKGRFRSLFSDKAIWTNVGPVLLFALLIYSMVFVTASKPYQMLLNGNMIAYVQDRESGQRLLEQATLEMSAPYPPESNFRQYAELDYTREGVLIKTKTTDEQEILDTLKSEIGWYVDGWSISVNNERTVFLPTKAIAEEVLDDVKKSYLPEGEELTFLDAEFVEPVEIIKEEIPIHILGSPDQAFRTLTEGREPVREYKVQSGDSYWSIAERNNMTVDELKLINGATSDRLAVGQVLKLSIPKPLLSVRVTVSSILTEEIPFDTVYQNNANVTKGETKVLAAGAVGTLEIEYEIAQINGFSVEQKVLSETVVLAPVDKVVENGTKVVVAAVAPAPSITASRGDPGEAQSGALAWPIRAKINSPFGNRSRGFHSGIDIQAKTGEAVYSAEGGTVISASFFSGYGNQVTIDHGDGLSTMYAHLSKISVSVGQVVGRQELVGLSGSTGRTTGPHLHFEVRINGSPVNPVNYLD